MQVQRLIGFYRGDATAKRQLVEEVRDCCLHNGFLQIMGHNVPIELQNRTMDWNKKFFDLELEEKNKLNKGKPSIHRKTLILS
jgi:isopenicillin N synthase-like dioxygenase